MSVQGINDFFEAHVPSSILLIVIIMVCFAAGVFVGNLLTRLKLRKKIRQERADALKKSRAVLRGQIYEQLAPYFPNFPVHPQSLRFLGSPVDYVAFVGNTQNPEIIDEIIFIEIKTGESTLSLGEKSIKDAIAQKRIRFVEYYL